MPVKKLSSPMVAVVILFISTQGALFGCFFASVMGIGVKDSIHSILFYMFPFAGGMLGLVISFSICKLVNKENETQIEIESEQLTAEKPFLSWFLGLLSGVFISVLIICFACYSLGIHSIAELY